MGQSVGKITALDFVDPDHYQELREVLQESTRKKEADNVVTRSSSNKYTTTVHDWGSIDCDHEQLNSASIKILEIQSFPLTQFVLMTATIPENVLSSIWSPNRNIDLNNIHSAMRNCWSQLFGERLPSLTLEYLNECTHIGGALYPITISTISTSLELHKAIADDTMVRMNQRTMSMYQDEFERGGVFDDIGMTVYDHRSLIDVSDSSVTVFGQVGNNTMPGEISSGYSFINMSIFGPAKPPFEEMPPFLDVRISGDYFIRFIQLLYLNIWFSMAQKKFQDHNKAVQKLSLSDVEVDSSVENIQEEMINLLDSESNFTDMYSKTKYHSAVSENFIESLEEWIQSEYNSEYGIPNPRTTDLKSGDPIKEGIFSMLITNTRAKRQETEKRYQELYHRYSTVSDQLDGLLSLQVSSTNIKLNRRILILTGILLGIAFLEVLFRLNLIPSLSSWTIFDLISWILRQIFWT